jgi:hypothetical protein
MSITNDTRARCWYDDHENLSELVSDLLDRGVIYGVAAIREILAEPWHYDREWVELQARKPVAA